MVNVSKRPLKKESSKKLFGQLAKSVARLTRTNSTDFLTGLLSETEHLMLAKRLAIILMLREDIPARSIARMLHVSRNTVIAAQKQYDEGRYGSIVRTVGKTRKEKEQMWRTIELVLRLGMPPRVGRERYQWLDKHFPRR